MYACQQCTWLYLQCSRLECFCRGLGPRPLGQSGHHSSQRAGHQDRDGQQCPLRQCSPSRIGAANGQGETACICSEVSSDLKMTCHVTVRTGTACGNGSWPRVWSRSSGQISQQCLMHLMVLMDLQVTMLPSSPAELLRHIQSDGYKQAQADQAQRVRGSFEVGPF